MPLGDGGPVVGRGNEEVDVLPTGLSDEGGEIEIG
ncbi:hypothetical protein GGP78_002964 [Salinibacter ruber]|nr:hypothetical protein [Salinibacter ruber]